MIYFVKACVQSAAQEASLEQWPGKLFDGYREKTHFGMKATFRGEAFKGWFADRRQPAMALRWLYLENTFFSTRGPIRRAAPSTWSES
jgi:hypothetical protein